MEIKMFRVKPDKLEYLDGLSNHIADAHECLVKLGGADFYSLLDIMSSSSSMPSHTRKDTEIISILLQLMEFTGGPISKGDDVKMFYLVGSKGFPGLEETLKMAELSEDELETLQRIELVEEIEGSQADMVINILAGVISGEHYLFTHDFRKTAKERLTDKIKDIPVDIVAYYFKVIFRDMGGAPMEDGSKEKLTTMALEILGIITPSVIPSKELSVTSGLEGIPKEDRNPMRG